MEGGSVWWWNYKVEVSGGTDFSGRISVNEELVPSKGKYIGIKAFPRKQPELIKEILLPLNYETKITYRPTSGFDKAPGSQIKGELVSEFNNGQQRIYSNLRNNRESEYFQFGANGGSWYNGKFTIEPEFTRIVDHRADLIIKSLRNKEVSDTFSVLLDYKHAYKLNLSGSSGSPGFSGGSVFPRSLSSQVYDDMNGNNGESGSDGPAIGVWADLYRDSVLNCDLLYVYAQNMTTSEEYHYLINPEGGSLVISSSGGSGGIGGQGERGIAGSDGADGEIWIEKQIEKQIVKKPVIKKVLRKEKKKRVDDQGKEYEVEVDVEVSETIYVDEEIEVVVEVVKQGPGQDGEDGGPGGAGGLGGVGGYGGDITLYLTDDAWQYQHLFVARSVGSSGGLHGSGGMGGPGGAGGHGNPNGHNGADGQSGPSAMGWADSGRSGKIQILSTEEFFNYSVK